MTNEPDFIALLRNIARDPAARGLDDDAAVWNIGYQTLVLAHDSMVEGVHFLSDDPPQDIAWKLVAVNFSDLAAKGAIPLACLTSYSLSGDPEWDRRFATGLGQALQHYGAILLGGDTVSQPSGDARCLGLTAIGRSTVPVPPARNGAIAGDFLYVTGAIGNGWAGLQRLRGGHHNPDHLISAYRRPVALINEGRALAQVAHAMMDISDGLLIDAKRMADASRLHVRIELDKVPLSPEFADVIGITRQTRLAAATGGDDYQLLFAADPLAHLPIAAHKVGKFSAGQGLSLYEAGESVPLPDNLGWLHNG